MSIYKGDRLIVGNFSDLAIIQITKDQINQETSDLSQEQSSTFKRIVASILNSNNQPIRPLYAVCKEISYGNHYSSAICNIQVDVSAVDPNDITYTIKFELSGYVFSIFLNNKSSQRDYIYRSENSFAPVVHRHNSTDIYYEDKISGTQASTVKDAIKSLDSANSYTSIEQVVGSYLGKPLYRKTIFAGQLPNNSTKAVMHYISNVNFFVDISGTANMDGETRTTVSLPLPSLTSPIILYVDATNVYITTITDRSDCIYSRINLTYTKTTD